MIPKRMNELLCDALSERTRRRRRQQEGPLVFMEFGPLDVDRLHRLGITVDSLGPRLVVCMWDEASPLEIGGYLVVDTLRVAMGQPSLGGIRMLPDLTPAAVHNLARGMTLKNAAADLPYGGGKAGIVAPPDLPARDREAVIRGFARLLRRYRHLYNPGPDVGTNDEDMKTIAIENGLDCVVSKPADMGGNRIDLLGGAAGGVVIAIKTLLAEMPRLRALPQFAGLEVPAWPELTVLIQGFGAVGAHVAHLLREEDGGAPRLVGVSDAQGYLFNETGLPVDELLQLQAEQRGLISQAYFLRHLLPETAARPGTKFGSDCNDLLREDAFCLVPAAPVANYLDTDRASSPAMTVDRMGRWRLIVEGANTYSPDPARKAARARMERAVYRQGGTLIAPDYLVNSGGVIFAAYERLIPTPKDLRIPDERLGNRAAVEDWLARHAGALAGLAEQRRLAAEEKRAAVISQNMRQLVDLLLADADCLPSEAAEAIAVSRIAADESYRTAADVMAPIHSIPVTATIPEAARALVDTKTDLVAVVDADNQLRGVLTDWDITKAAATGCGPDCPLTEIMTANTITCAPEDLILDIVRKLEHFEISAMPVVAGEKVVGVVSGDLLARTTLHRLLQAREAS